MTKEVYLTSRELKSVREDKIEIVIPDTPVEADVDYDVKTALITKYKKSCVKLKKTGKKEIDLDIPSATGSGNGNGEIDVIIYNQFGNEKIEMIIEDKTIFSGKKISALEQAKVYANGINAAKGNDSICRVIIGFLPGIEVRVLVNSKWEKLMIDGNEIDYFFGPAILKLVYDNPNVSNFILKEKGVADYTSKDFQTLISSKGVLHTLFRDSTTLNGKEELQINFMVAFIALKMIMEKNDHHWIDIMNIDDLINYVDNITNSKKNQKNYKYRDIFIIKDREENDETQKELFNFSKLLKTLKNEDSKKVINKSLNENGKNIDITLGDKYAEFQINKGRFIDNISTVMQIHSFLVDIPSQKDSELQFDLFGEIYEGMAGNKTKATLGEYFTRRHIIRPMVRIMLDDNKIQNILKNPKDNQICDPFCGTGGFLTETFKYIKEVYRINNPKEDEFTQRENLHKISNLLINGFDVNNGSIGRTRVNMTLAGDGFSRLDCVNSFKDINELSGVFRYILTNVPYGKGKIAIKDANGDEFLQTNNNKRLEVNGLIKVVQLLEMGGLALVVIPDGILEAPSLQPLREWFLKQCNLKYIISLPKFAFAPYTKEKTYIMIFEKRFNPLKDITDLVRCDEYGNVNSEQYYSYIIDNDGYANSDKKFQTGLTNEIGKPLHNELAPWINLGTGKLEKSMIEDIMCRDKKVEDMKQEWSDEWNNKISGKKYGFISMEKVMENKIEKSPKLNTQKVNKIIMETYKFSIDNDGEIQILETQESSIDYYNIYEGILSEDSIGILNTVIKKLANGKFSNIKKEHYFDEENNDIRESFTSVFDDLGIRYDSEENAFYNTKIVNTTYSLNLLPEKYFRTPEIKEIRYDELEDETKKINEELFEFSIKQLLGKKDEENLTEKDYILIVNKLKEKIGREKLEN